MSSKMLRWTTLVMVAFVMMMGYVFWDIVSPLSTSLKLPVEEGGMAWTSSEYGFFAGSYSIFNIFLLMLFWGGIILDKMGIRFTGVLATGMMLAGALVCYYGIRYVSPESYTELRMTLFGLIPSPVKWQVLVASVGFGLFGVGCDITGITVSKVVTKWFTGHELASAMGIQVAMARLGTASAISLSPVIALSYGISMPVMVGAVLLGIGFVCFIVYTFMDKRYDDRLSMAQQSAKAVKTASCTAASTDDDSFSFRDFKKVLHNKGFWMMAILCVFFYSSIRPFLKFTTDLLINKYGIQPVTAGWITSILPYGTIILTPLFGNIYDRIGRGATLMLIGCIITTCCHFCFRLPIINTTWFASVLMVLLGVSFSLVPSAMWPSVPKIVPLKQLGTAYSIIYFVQNIGLMLVPMLVGNIIGAYTSADGKADFTVPMLVFAGFGLASVVVAIMLRKLDNREHYGLEQANIIKKNADEAA